jgi:cardiolipin synthase
VNRPIPLKPLLVSKLNTVAQIALACLVLAALGFRFNAGITIQLLVALVAALTLLSVVFYVLEWIRHVNAVESG